MNFLINEPNHVPLGNNDSNTEEASQEDQLSCRLSSSFRCHLFHFEWVNLDYQIASLQDLALACPIWSWLFISTVRFVMIPSNGLGSWGPLYKVVPNRAFIHHNFWKTANILPNFLQTFQVSQIFNLLSPVKLPHHLLLHIWRVHFFSISWGVFLVFVLWFVVFCFVLWLMAISSWKWFRVGK